MAAKITIDLPAALNNLIGKEESISLEADTPEQAMSRLGKRYPKLREILLNEAGELRNRLVFPLFLNSSPISRAHGEMGQKLRDGDLLVLLAPISGG